ncbi:MAG: metallophosphoesterase, partial [Bdellovibrionales bacterium]|nr:metallophosphoesterase [Bdellovibrionales bacterium]
QPVSCFEAKEAGFDIMLCGHTHAGQFFPYSTVVGFFNPYVKGLNRHENSLWVYVNVGTGFWGPPTRLLVPSEITKIRLVKEQQV